MERLFVPRDELRGEAIGRRGSGLTEIETAYEELQQDGLHIY